MRFGEQVYGRNENRVLLINEEFYIVVFQRFTILLEMVSRIFTFKLYYFVILADINEINFSFLYV